jgi:hypothetical protein
MNIESGLMLNALVKYFHHNNGKDALKFLPPEEVDAVSKLPVPGSLPSSAFWDSAQLLQMIHYSWFFPLVRTYPREWFPYLIAAFPEDERKGLEKLLEIEPQEVDFPEGIKEVFRKVLCEALRNRNVLPAEFVPDGPLKVILQLTKQQLVQLIDLLGLYDLAIDVRQVLDKKILDQVLGRLNAKEQKFLRYCLQQPDIHVGPSEGIMQWMKAENFSVLRHLKGLQRLAAAVENQSKSLIWHLVHRVDIGRGEKIQRLITSKFVAGLPAKQKDLIVRQVVVLLKLFVQQDGESVS